MQSIGANQEIEFPRPAAGEAGAYPGRALFDAANAIGIDELGFVGDSPMNFVGEIASEMLR